MVVFLRIDEDTDGNVATRNVDYTAALSPLTIKAGSLSGTTTITITPRNDKQAEGDETIRLTGAYAQTVVPAEITLKDADGGGTSEEPEELDKPEEPDKSSLAFADDAAIDDQTYTLGTEITPLVLPAALGGTGELTYSVSALPAGLSFDASTRTISGTPTAETNGAAIIIYTVIGGARVSSPLIFSITVELPPPVADAKILLTVDPTVISEDAGPTDVVVTGTLDELDGPVFDDDVVVLLTFDEDINGDGEVSDDKAAVLNVDYVAVVRRLTIPAGSVSGTTTITITPINDNKVEGDETIRLRLTRIYANNQISVQDAEGDDVKMAVVPVDITLQDIGEDSASFFAADAAIDDGVFTEGTPIVDWVLPAASGGTGELMYGVSGLPEGLSFDVATRTLSGVPAAVTNGAVTIVYTATDESGTTDTLTFTITVNPCLCDNWDLLFDLWTAFAADAAIDDQVYTAGTAIAALVLPEASGGTGELTYSVSTLPAGLAFDAATRTLSGTPTAATDGAVDVIYTATDEDGTTDALAFTITVNPPLSFDTLLDLFGAGKVVPTASRD